MRISSLVIPALLSVATLASGPAVAQTFGPPPPPVAGPIYPAPGPGYVLVPGHYRWNGVRYVWIGQHWVVRPPRYTRWVPGHWGPGPYGRWHWVPGHWV